MPCEGAGQPLTRSALKDTRARASMKDTCLIACSL
jgi:hypothetical protein